MDSIRGSLNIPYYEYLRKDRRELLHFTYVNLNCQEIFLYYYSRNDTLLHTTVLVPYRTYQFAVCEPVKLRICLRFNRGMKNENLKLEKITNCKDFKSLMENSKMFR